MGNGMSRIAVIIFCIALLVLPTAFSSGYFLFQLTLVVTYAVAILGLNLVTGYNGQVSLGHGAFYAVGAYTTAILMDKFNVPYWATLPVAAVLCTGFGFLIGLPALRLGGLYLALTTFALSVAVPQLLKYKAFDDYTGGVQGIVIDKPEAPFGLHMTSDQWVYVFTLMIGIICFVLIANLVKGRIGRAMIAIRDQPLAAEAMGIDIAMLKTYTFAVSAMITGVAGSLGAIAVQFVAPDAYGAPLSLTFFVGFVVGGGASIVGPIFGAIFVEFIPNIADQISKAAPGAVYGVLLIALMFLAPGGCASLVRMAAKYMPWNRKPT